MSASFPTSPFRSSEHVILLPEVTDSGPLAFKFLSIIGGARGSVVAWDTTCWKVAGSSPYKVIEFFFQFTLFFRPPLWSSGQGTWLQIQRSGYDSQRYQIFWGVVGLERCPLSLVSTIEELLGRKSRGSDIENREYGSRGSTALTTWNQTIRKSWH
jgi:hypothetical protein